MNASSFDKQIRFDQTKLYISSLHTSPKPFSPKFTETNCPFLKNSRWKISQIVKLQPKVNYKNTTKYFVKKYSSETPLIIFVK